MATFRPDLYDDALGRRGLPAASAVAAFAGPAFHPENIPEYLASFDVAKRA
jgi:hypothetical protein